MKTYFAVTGVVKNDGKILILKKSQEDYNYPGKWSFCSGYVKEFEAVEDTVLREIKEETGLDARIVKKGKIFLARDAKKKKGWFVMPFLCSVNSQNVKLDHENVDFKWINIKDLKNYPTIPGVRKELEILNIKNN